MAFSTLYKPLKAKKEELSGEKGAKVVCLNLSVHAKCLRCTLGTAREFLLVLLENLALELVSVGNC